MKALIIVKEGLEECEALITYDLLYRAGIETDIAGTQDEVTSSHRLTFRTHKLLKDIDPDGYDCLILPGGMPGTRNLEEDPDVIALIDHFVENGRYVAAICAAPSILLHKGLLKNERFVCFPGFESGYVPADVKAIKDGPFITAKGMGAAFEFAHLIISTLSGKEKADEVLKQVQYY